MGAILGLLIIVAGFQAMGLSSLKAELSSESTVLEPKTSSNKVATANTGGDSNKLKNNLNNLPSMVGGC
jgi:hypothetical protein